MVRRQRDGSADGRPGGREDKLVRSEHWHGLVPGDIVKVSGERGALFIYRCHVLNRRNGACWVELDELAHGSRGAVPARSATPHAVVRRQRSVEVERVVRLPRQRRRREAPQGTQESFGLFASESAAPLDTP